MQCCELVALFITFAYRFGNLFTTPYNVNYKKQLTNYENNNTNTLNHKYIYLWYGI